MLLQASNSETPVAYPPLSDSVYESDDRTTEPHTPVDSPSSSKSSKRKRKRSSPEREETADKTVAAADGVESNGTPESWQDMGKGKKKKKKTCKGMAPTKKRGTHQVTGDMVSEHMDECAATVAYLKGWRSAA